MNLRERLALLNRLQHGRAFKLVATAIVVLLGVALGGSYVVWQKASRVEEIAVPDAPFQMTDAELARLSAADRAVWERAQAVHRADVAIVAQLNAMRRSQLDPTVVLVGVGALTLVALGVVWIGHALTGLLVVALLAGVCLPLELYGRTLSGDRADLGRSLRDAAKFIAGAGVLGFSFVVLMELLRAALSGPSRVLAIARNVVNEAVRMKVSIVFIVLLVLGLASLPGLLDPSTPLRYRVQNFLQYGTGGSFWIIAVLTLLLAVGTVAFEQRDKIIWQTMTKPVAAWQYVLGKWLGVAGVAAVLLGVSTAGVFLFTEYLRRQPAMGERAPFVPEQELQRVTEDRYVLEFQVLAARRSVGPEYPELTAEDEARELQNALENIRKIEGETFLDTPERRAQILDQLRAERRTAFLTVGSGQTKTFHFPGLGGLDSPATLRYKVEVGANDPRTFWRVTFHMLNSRDVVQTVPLGQTLTLPVAPGSIDEKGVFSVDVVNGDSGKAAQGDPAWANAESMTFPPDGLEVYYPAGSYRLNFARVVAVLWLKLAFLAMVGIAAATFLSFSVASLVAFGVFLLAESSGFLNTSLEYFSSTDDKKNVIWWKAAVRLVAVPVAGAFTFYSNLNPTGDLVDGRLVGWDTLALAALTLGALTALLYAVAVFVFRRRELATYSGQ